MIGTRRSVAAGLDMSDDANSVPAQDYNARYYDLYYPAQGPLREEIESRVGKGLKLAHVAHGMKVLDVGCGPGDFLLGCARAGAFAWGVDYSQDAVAVARSGIGRARPELREMISVEAMDAKDLAFRDGSFDVVTMMDVVEHLHPQELNQALREVVRVLKRPGRLVIRTMPNAWISRPAYRIAALLARRRVAWDSEHFHVNEQSPRSLVRCLRWVGGSQTLVMGKAGEKYFESHLPCGALPLLRQVARVLDSLIDSTLGEALVFGTPLKLLLGTELWAVVDL